MTDIIERLRKVEHGPTRQPGVTTNWYRNPDGPEAADEIERLRARLSGAQETAMSDIDIMRTLHLERIEEQKAEIERLRAERDDWHKVADIRSAEIEWLRDEVALGIEVEMKLREDNDSLRDEIERLRQGCTFDKDGLPLTVCTRLADARADYDRLLTEYDEQEARLKEAEGLLRVQNYWLAKWYPDKAEEVYRFLHEVMS